jgi:hypothetical protein
MSDQELGTISLELAAETVKFQKSITAAMGKLNEFKRKAEEVERKPIKPKFADSFKSTGKLFDSTERSLRQVGDVAGLFGDAKMIGQVNDYAQALGGVGFVLEGIGDKTKAATLSFGGLANAIGGVFKALLPVVGAFIGVLGIIGAIKKLADADTFGTKGKQNNANEASYLQALNAANKLREGKGTVLNFGKGGGFASGVEVPSADPLELKSKDAAGFAKLQSDMDKWFASLDDGAKVMLFKSEEFNSYMKTIKMVKDAQTADALSKQPSMMEEVFKEAKEFFGPAIDVFQTGADTATGWLASLLKSKKDGDKVFDSVGSTFNEMYDEWSSLNAVLSQDTEKTGEEILKANAEFREMMIMVSDGAKGLEEEWQDMFNPQPTKRPSTPTESKMDGVWSGAASGLMQGKSGEVVSAAAEGSAAGPWGAIIAAAAKILSFTEHFSQLIDQSNSIVGSIVQVVDGLLKPFTAVHGMITMFGKLVLGIINVLTEIGNAFNIGLPIVEAVMEVFEEGMKAFAQIFNNIVEFITMIFRKLADFKIFGKRIFGFADDIADNLQDSLINLDPEKAATYADTLDMLDSSAKDAAESLGDFVGVLNAPSGFKLPYHRYASIDGGGGDGRGALGQNQQGMVQVSVQTLQVVGSPNVESIVNELMNRTNVLNAMALSANPSGNTGLPPQGGQNVSAPPSSSSAAVVGTSGTTSAGTKPSAAGPAKQKYIR